MDDMSYKKSKNEELLDEFINSGQECAEIKSFECTNARTCAASFRNSIRRFSKTHSIKVVQNGSRVFLVRV